MAFVHWNFLLFLRVGCKWINPSCQGTCASSHKMFNTWRAVSHLLPRSKKKNKKQLTRTIIKGKNIWSPPLFLLIFFLTDCTQFSCGVNAFSEFLPLYSYIVWVLVSKRTTLKVQGIPNKRVRLSGSYFAVQTSTVSFIASFRGHLRSKWLASIREVLVIRPTATKKTAVIWRKNLIIPLL